MNDNTQNTDKKYKLPQSPDARKRRFIAGVGLATTMLVSGYTLGSSDAVRAKTYDVIEQVSSSPSDYFNEDTVSYTLQEGEGLYSAANHIQGIDRIDKRIAIDYIEQLNNLDNSSVLQQGQSIVIPKSVKD